MGCAWSAPRPDKSPAALYGAPAAPACPLQRVQVATGYDCQESEECETQYEEKCSTEYENQCSTVYDEKCETKYETTYEEQCETKYEQVNN